MKKLFYLTTLLLITGMYACNCGGDYQCPALTTTAINSLSQNDGDLVTFTTAGGKQFVFTVRSKSASAIYNEACAKIEGSCECPECEASGDIYANTDSARNEENSYEIKVNETNFEGTQITTSNLTYDIFDFSKTMDLLQPGNIAPGDSLLTTLTLGAHTYSDVYVHSVDTLLTKYADQQVWKAYFTQTNGLVGFYDRLTNSLYYRL